MRIQESKDMEKLQAFFTRLLEKAERLARMLDVSLEENPSEQAKAAVSNVRALVDSGKAALKVRDNAAMADVTRKLTTLLQGASA
jgi:molecular chaperone DnaK